VVATSQPLAAQAGLDVLRRGGNAMDAAIATAAALTVVEPTNNGLGGDNFALIWADGQLHALNGSGRAPLGLRRSDYAGLERIARTGWAGVTTPGAVAGWAAVHERFGSFPFARLLAPAIEYAERGYLVSPDVARAWASAARLYTGAPTFQAWRATFLKQDRAPRSGESIQLPDHAGTLQRIAETHGRALYEGNLADKVDAEARRFGGSLRKRDLTSHESEWVTPISVDYRGYRLYEGPPNGQGLAALIGLGILRHFEIAQLPVDSAENLHLQIEAMKLAFAEALRHIADPHTMDIAPRKLLEPSYLRRRAAQIDKDRAQDFEPGSPRPDGTVLLTTADASGNLVSFIQSNYTGFGSGVVVPGTGIALQNRGCCFSLEEGHPNELAPGKRPYHTIIPGLLTRIRDDAREEPVLTFGVMGGFMQPQGHLQVVTRMLDHGQNPQAALDAPRWQIEGGRRINIEPGFPDAVYDGLASRGHAVARKSDRSAMFGRGQTIWRLEGGYAAGSDLRADGQAVGF